MLKGLLRQLVARRRPASGAGDLVARARQSVAAHDWLEAGRLLEEALELAPMSVPALLGHKVQRWPQAAADYDETAALVRALDLVIRQSSVGDWAPVVGAVVHALGERFPARLESTARC